MAKVSTSTAYDMIAQREAEIKHLTTLLAAAREAKHKRVLKTRILATRNNLQSWKDHLETGRTTQPPSSLR